MNVSTADYSPLQRERLSYVAPLPAAFASGRALRVLAPLPPVDSELRAWLPRTLPASGSAPEVAFVAAGAPGAAAALPTPAAPLKVGVVFCGRQCPGGHNVVAGLFDALAALAPGSTLLGFVGGTVGLFQAKTTTLTAEALAPFRNQVRRGRATQRALPPPAPARRAPRHAPPPRCPSPHQAHACPSPPPLLLPLPVTTSTEPPREESDDGFEIFLAAC